MTAFHIVICRWNLNETKSPCELAITFCVYDQNINNCDSVFDRAWAHQFLVNKFKLFVKKNKPKHKLLMLTVLPCHPHASIHCAFLVTWSLKFTVQKNAANLPFKNWQSSVIDNLDRYNQLTQHSIHFVFTNLLLSIWITYHVSVYLLHFTTNLKKLKVRSQNFRVLDKEQQPL